MKTKENIRLFFWVSALAFVAAPLLCAPSETWDTLKGEALGSVGALYKVSGREPDGQQYTLESRRIRTKLGVDGVPIGIQTEVFFEEVAMRKGAGQKRLWHWPLTILGLWLAVRLVLYFYRHYRPRGGMS